MRTFALTGLGPLIACALAASVAGQARTEQRHPDQYTSADIAYGARIYDAQCTTCHGSNGDGVGGVNLRSGRFRNATSDQDLARVITAGITGTGMLAFTLDPSELTGVIAFLRNMNTFDPGTIALGDEARGRAIVEGRGVCLQCHRVGKRGSRVAPDLTDIGSLRGPGSLQRSLVDPTSQMMPINRPVKAVTRDGKVISGRRLNEDTYTVQLVDEQERLVSLDKSQLREFTIQPTSPMPSYKGKLSEGEIADTVAYLLSLKGRQ
jgi:putative heme-binding domain-containing protein